MCINQRFALSLCTDRGSGREVRGGIGVGGKSVVGKLFTINCILFTWLKKEGEHYPFGLMLPIFVLTTL